MSDYVSLTTACALLAKRLGLDAATLVAYANEDTHGGADTGLGAMSLDRDEGRLLYALIRALRPPRVIEIGVCQAVSSAHLLAALDANDSGVLDSYDIDPLAGTDAEPHRRWGMHTADALEVDFGYADFVFEDAAHTLDFSTAIYGKLKALAPRIIVVHDYYTDEVYENFFVRQAFEAVFGDEAFGVKLENCFRGLGVWINPMWVETETITSDPPNTVFTISDSRPSDAPLLKIDNEQRISTKRVRREKKAQHERH